MVYDFLVPGMNSEQIRTTRGVQAHRQCSGSCSKLPELKLGRIKCILNIYSKGLKRANLTLKKVAAQSSQEDLADQYHKSQNYACQVSRHREYWRIVGVVVLADSLSPLHKKQSWTGSLFYWMRSYGCKMQILRRIPFYLSLEHSRTSESHSNEESINCPYKCH